MTHLNNEIGTHTSLML